jgi:hypothetical protein
MLRDAARLSGAETRSSFTRCAMDVAEELQPDSLNRDATKKYCDEALADNRRAGRRIETIIVIVAVLAVCSDLLVSWLGKPHIVAGSGALQTLALGWLVSEVLKIRRDNLTLRLIPTLPEAEAIEEIRKFLAHLRGEKPFARAFLAAATSWGGKRLRGKP